MPKKVNIKGVIVDDDDKVIYDWFGIQATSPQSVNDELKDANGEEIEVIVNSPGGSVFAGSEIYTALKSYKGRSVGKIVGEAASAASFAVLGCDTVSIAPTAQMMIHNAWTRVVGDYKAMEHGSDFLKKTNLSIINAYRLKTGKSEEELKAMMDKETWMTAQEAVENGFADEIMFDEKKQLVASSISAAMLPPEVINKVRNLLAKDNSKREEQANIENKVADNNIDKENQQETQEQNEQEEQTKQQEEAEVQAKQKRIIEAKLKLIKIKGKVIE